jgi:hypothetical protein
MKVGQWCYILARRVQVECRSLVSEVPIAAKMIDVESRSFHLLRVTVILNRHTSTPPTPRSFPTLRTPSFPRFIILAGCRNCHVLADATLSRVKPAATEGPSAMERGQNVPTATSTTCNASTPKPWNRDRHGSSSTLQPSVGAWTASNLYSCWIAVPAGMRLRVEHCHRSRGSRNRTLLRLRMSPDRQTLASPLCFLSWTSHS